MYATASNLCKFYLLSISVWITTCNLLSTAMLIVCNRSKYLENLKIILQRVLKIILAFSWITFTKVEGYSKNSMKIVAILSFPLKAGFVNFYFTKTIVPYNEIHIYLKYFESLRLMFVKCEIYNRCLWNSDQLIRIVKCFVLWNWQLNAWL